MEKGREQGLLHIYCGDGKGKTTAATGLAVRAAGCGMKILFVRFLKNENSGELRILDSIPGIEVLRPSRSFGFYDTLSEKEKTELHRVYGILWREIVEKVESGSYHMLVMDEFTWAYSMEIVKREESVRFLESRPQNLEVVLTGRDPAAELLEMADYVSEIEKRKHPFDRGVCARRGIEY